MYWYLLCFHGLQILMTVYELQFLSYVSCVWSRCRLLLNKHLWQLNEPSSPTCTKLQNLVSAACFVFNCLTAYKNKLVTSTKCAHPVHITYLYNSKLVWEFLQPLLKMSRVHTRMPDHRATEDNENIYKHVNRQYES